MPSDDHARRTTQENRALSESTKKLLQDYQFIKPIGADPDDIREMSDFDLQRLLNLMDAMAYRLRYNRGNLHHDHTQAPPYKIDAGRGEIIAREGLNDDQ